MCARSRGWPGAELCLQGVRAAVAMIKVLPWNDAGRFNNAALDIQVSY